MEQKRALREVLVFFALTLGASFLAFWGPLAVFQVPTISFVSDVKGPGWAIALFMLGGFVPSLVALLLTGLWEGRAGLRRMGKRVIQFNLGWRWYLAAVGGTALVGAGQLALLGILGQTFDLSLFAQQLGSFLPLLIIGPLSEELGWRGYAQSRLQTRFNPVAASLMVGVCWSLWHLPLFYMVGTSQHELAMPFLGFLLTYSLYSIFFGWVYNHTRGSIWSAVLIHWLGTYVAQVIATGATRTPLYNWLEFVPYLIVAALVVAAWRPTWGDQLAQEAA